MEKERGQPGGCTPPVRHTCTAPNAHRPGGLSGVRCKCPICTKQAGQMSIFFALLLVALVTFMLIGVEVGRVVYARGEVGKAADAAALAAASRINIALYRETGQVIFLPDVYDYAQAYATTNSSYLASCSIPVSVTGVSIDVASQTVSVSVTANLSALLPAVLNYQRHYTVTGFAKGRLDGR